MKTFLAVFTAVPAAVLALGLFTATVPAAYAQVYLPCHPNCGTVCVPGGTMKCS